MQLQEKGKLFEMNPESAFLILIKKSKKKKEEFRKHYIHIDPGVGVQA